MRRGMRGIAWILIIGLATFAAGCSRVDEEKLDTLMDTRWYLVSFSDRRGPHPIPTDPLPFLEVRENALSFSNGCNEVHANAQVGVEKFAIERVIMRGIDCRDFVSAESEALEYTVADSMVGWSAYAVEDDELVIPFDGGEIRFSRAMPSNPFALRAFPLQRATHEKPAYSEGLFRGDLIMDNGCLRIRPTSIDVEPTTDYLVVWPAEYAVGIDENTIKVVTAHGAYKMAEIGDDLVVSGGRLEEILPVVNIDFFFLSTIPDECPGPYWVVKSVLALD